MKPIRATHVRAALVCGVLILDAGCFLGKKPTVSASLPAPPAPIAAPAPTAPAEHVPVPVPAPSPPTEALPQSQPIKPSPFPPPAKPARKPSRPAPTQPEAEAEAEAPAIVPTPSLGVILTADQKKQLDASYQSDLRKANAALSRLNGRALTPGQADTVTRARAFIRQAAQYRDRDLATAAELARRARVLTQDLAGAPK